MSIFFLVGHDFMSGYITTLSAHFGSPILDFAKFSEIK